MLFIPDSGEYAMLNDVSTVIVTALGSALTLDSVVDRVLGEYEAPRDVVAQDVEHLVRELVAKGAAEEVLP